MSFSRGANPIWSFVDLTGAQLDDTYYMNYLSNVSPYLPQNVYHNPDGTTPWANPLQFLANGTLPDNVYGMEDVAYRLQVRKGPLSSDPLIYSIDNYFSNETGGSAITEVSQQQNQASNPQFFYVNFGINPIVSAVNPSFTVTTSGTYQIAPGWQLILGGSGTCTVTQVITPANQAQPSDNVPPYFLRINSNGWSSVILQQQFNDSGSLWANDYLSIAINALSESGFAQPISINYVPSGSTATPIVSSVPLSTGNFAIIQGSSLIPSSTSTALNNVSYIDIQIVLPGTSIVDISDVQIIASANAFPVTFVPTPDDSIERQTDQLFHYYANELIIKPKKSILTGWIFPQNPYQFSPFAITSISSKCSYVLDQTILYQDGTNQVQVGQNSAAFRYGFVVGAVLAATQSRFALIQYIDPSTILPYWSYIVSALAKVRISTGANSQIRVKMRLIWRTSLPSSLSPTEPIVSWAGNSDPVFGAGWTAIAPLNDPTYILTNGTYPGGTVYGFPDISFDGFQLPECSTGTMTLGVVFYTMDPMSSASGFQDSIMFDSISLVPNRFAVESSPTTFDETLRECQFYYEKSYERGVLPGSIDGNGSIYQCPLIYSTATPSSVSSYTPVSSALYLQEFSFQFKQIKRALPHVKYWSPDSTASNFQIGIVVNGSSGTTTDYPPCNGGGAGSNPIDIAISNWTTIQISTTNVRLAPTGAGTRQLYLNTADSTLGGPIA